ncbi:endonuclease/exonuclease/phosphatase family protein [Streptomyces sp. MZ04]|uniref:endonuclease/exonuclease/phosphatase family protein n=1 Tax=Streptomyces sp. MZ04 TaxID=2559236 RepID=UPI001432A106|nr:endonuclease/exonuclease/phosphatase family protein [Streptomyces sp. MZ04]
MLTSTGTATAVDGAPGLPDKVSVLSWNACGAYEGCPHWDKPELRVDQVVKAVQDDPSVAVIMLQEVCLGLHAEPLQERLGDGWQVQFRAAPVVRKDPVTGDHEGPTRETGDLGTVHTCLSDKRVPTPEAAPSALLNHDEQGNDQRVQAGGRRDLAGVLVAMKKLPGSELHPVNMTFVEDKKQGAACIKDTGNLLFACSSHFLNKGADPDELSRTASGRDFRDQTVHLQAQGYRTVIGGDLNATPDSKPLQPLYDGNFEADVNQKRPTHTSGGKLDHIFFSDYGWDLVGARLDYPGDLWGMPSLDLRATFGVLLSDHWMFKGTVNPVTGW